ncbi:metal ABC transporter permease [Mechercharimyces sp. CAU 1602]|uniref:metal ABC transporter permease n=1 Tax=Mechercharimyces sp. CAU 1602 TaxID=2973933 RepID=UPI0021628490|nr:metal ABC transporter permease [Mechercharimyces sp. CAU 1602]MCS1350986.1 metal ABC transporter permease [Mechercharimyces sp. CAU 1602]
MSIFMDPNAWWVLSGTTLLGLCSGVLGSFAFLRKRGLMGDVLAHAALPGICLAFMLIGSKNSFAFLLGAIFTGVLGSLCIQWITRYSRIKEDTALGLVLSVFFGFGIVLLTQIQHSNDGNQSGLDKFLFGQSASMVPSDVTMMSIISVVLLMLCFLFFKELKLLCFDAQFGQSIGFSLRGLDFLLMLFLVIAVVIGLQVAGVVLMAAMLITPAAAARYWTEKLHLMVIISAVMGALSGVLGTWISALGYNLSTGPLIVMAATTMFIVSMIFAPKRGLLAKWIHHLRTRKQVAHNQMLEQLFLLSLETKSLSLSLSDIPKTKRPSNSQFKELEKEELLTFSSSEQTVQLSEEGFHMAYEVVLKKRMFEMWLMHESDLEGEYPVREKISQSYIPDEIKQRLHQLLVQHQYEPQWHPQLQERRATS